MKIKSIQVALITVLTIFLGVLISDSMGLWTTKNNKRPATYQSGEFKGRANPEDIRGSYTFDEISVAFEVPIEDLLEAFELDSSSLKCKDLKTIYANASREIGTASVKLFVALYKGLPYTMTEDVFLPTKAVDILLSKATLSKEQQTYIEDHRSDND